MKNKIAFGIALMMMLSAVFVYADLKPNVAVLGYSSKGGNPYAGKGFTLAVQLSNIEASTCAKAVSSSIQADFPFIANGLSTIYLGDLCKSDTKEVDFPLKVDPTATGGSYPVTITNSYESTTYISFSSQSTINIYINGTPELNAHVIGSNPVDVYPGETATISINVQNNGDFRAESVNAALKAESPVEVKWSKSFNSIALLDPKQSQTIDFAVEVPKDAKAKNYQLALELSYYDQDKELQEKTLMLDFLVKKKARFGTSDNGKNSLYANQDSKQIKLQLKNTGTDAARKIKAKILPQFPFSTDGSVRYIDLLEAGNSAPIEFNVDVDIDAKPGTYSVDLLIDFEDGQGKKFQDTAKATLTVNSKGFFRAVFLDYWFLWLIVAVAALIFARRKIKPKK